MRSSSRAQYSCSSSCASSPSDSPLAQGDGADVTRLKSRGRSYLQRRFMRHWKLGHADCNAKDKLWPRNSSRSTPVSPESTPKAWEGRSDPWWSTAVPQPLPLPERASLRLPEERCSYVERKHGSNNTSTSFKPSTYCKRVFSDDLHLDSHNLRINISARSAPGSCLPTPPVSPQKSIHQDLFASKPEVPTIRSLSDFEIPTSTLPRFSSHVSLDPAVKCTHHPDHSPLHSPTRSQLNPRSPRGISSSYSHHKSPSETNINAHPLPLPPGPLPCLSSNNSPHGIENNNISSVKGQWKKGKLIGRGTFGSVYAATNRETGALCAMKEVDVVADDPRSAECIRQLEQEIRVLRQLKHPNIVQYYGSETIEDHFYIYLGYVYPGSINKYVHEHFGTMTEAVVRNFTRHILSGLAFLHSKNIIHRDIKGANLLVDAMGVVKLADFGMAKHLSGQVSVLSLKGSPYWLAPELLQGAVTSNTNPDVAFAVDIWSVGCTVIEMLTGKPPWSELGAPQALFKVLNRSPPIPEKLSSEGKDFLQRCFRRNPAERPSATALLQHPFLRNSNDQHVSIVKQPFADLNLADKSQGPKDHAKHRFDLFSIRSGAGISNGTLALEG